MKKNQVSALFSINKKDFDDSHIDFISDMMIFWNLENYYDMEATFVCHMNFIFHKKNRKTLQEQKNSALRVDQTFMAPQTAVKEK